MQNQWKYSTKRSTIDIQEHDHNSGGQWHRLTSYLRYGLTQWLGNQCTSANHQKDQKKYKNPRRFLQLMKLC